MKRNRDNSGQGALIIFSVFVTVILLAVGVTLSLSQVKESTRTIYAEANLRTYYAAMSGIEEALGSRFVPRSNIYAMRTSSVATQIASIAPQMRNNLSSTTADATYPPIYPNSGVILANPSATPSISNMDTLKNQILGTYLYRITGGEAQSQQVATVGKPAGKPSNVISDKMVIYSVGYSVLPNNSIDKVGIIATVDINREDQDPIGCDEVESLQLVTDPSDVATQVEAHLNVDTAQPAVNRFVAYSYSKINFDIVTNDFMSTVYSDSPPIYPSSYGNGRLPNAGTTTGTWPTNFPTSPALPTDPDYTVSTNSQIRIFFTKAIDPRSVAASGNITIYEYDATGSSVTGTYTGQNILTNVPASNTIILMFSNSSSPISSDTNYQVSIRDIRDFENNVMTGPVSFRLRTK